MTMDQARIYCRDDSHQKGDSEKDRDTYRVHPEDSDEGTDTVADIIATVVQGSKASSKHLEK